MLLAVVCYMGGLLAINVIRHKYGMEAAVLAAVACILVGTSVLLGAFVLSRP